MTASDSRKVQKIVFDVAQDPIPRNCKSAMESMLGTEAYVSHMQACAFKYIWRWRDKNGIEDLKKARECIGNMIRAIEGDGDE